MPYLSSKLFDYDRATDTFYAEVSELGPQPFGSVFNDAIDSGFSMVSAKTAAIADFYIYNTNRDADSDVTHWLLKPTRDTIQLFPSLRNTTAVVWND